MVCLLSTLICFAEFTMLLGNIHIKVIRGTVGPG